MRVLALYAALSLALTGCGARSSLVEPPDDAGEAPAPDASTPTRVCPLDCLIGHECCLGGCDGPAVAMPSDCCSCLPGEISTMTCGTLKCGG